MTATTVMRSSFQAMAIQAPRSSGSSILTTREMEVLSAVAGGKSNTGIADALFISRKSVEKHINSIFAKLGLNAESDDHPRVRAVLVYLTELGSVPPAGPEPAAPLRPLAHPRSRPTWRALGGPCRHPR